MLRHISERYARGFGAALIAVGALVLAANAGPARAADTGQVGQVQQVQHAG
ncbi:hypothetical protein [Streptomyces spinosirectus]